MMNYSFIESFTAGLFIYVVTTILLGGISWAFGVLSDSTVLTIGAVLGVATFSIFIMRHK